MSSPEGFSIPNLEIDPEHPGRESGNNDALAENLATVASDSNPEVDTEAITNGLLALQGALEPGAPIENVAAFLHFIEPILNGHGLGLTNMGDES